MLYLGELVKRISEEEDGGKRIELLRKNITGSLITFLRIVRDNTEWDPRLKDRELLSAKDGYGRTVSDFYREMKKVIYFRKGISDNIATNRLIDMYEKVQVLIHKDEAQILHDLVNGTFVWPQPEVEIDIFLGKVS